MRRPDPRPDAARVAWTPAAGLAWALAGCLAVGSCSNAAVGDADGARALARVVHQVEAGPRIPGAPGTPGHEAIRRWIAAELTRLGGEVEEQTFTDSTLGHPIELTNVIGRFGPANARRVALAAHWDSRPWSDEDQDSAHRADPVPGANDGASGVAVLLEVAEAMHRRAPPVGVDLVFLDGEDLGDAHSPDHFCLGSKGFAQRLGSRKPAAAFVFDMVGDKDLEIHPEVNSTERAANLVALIGDAADATGAKHFHDDPRYRLFDDHMPLLDAGIPAADIIDFDYPAWHTHRDTPDQVSAASLAEVSRVATWLVYRSPLAHP